MGGRMGEACWRSMYLTRVRESYRSVELVIFPGEWLWWDQSRFALGLRERICARNNALRLRRRRLRGATTELESKERVESIVVEMRFEIHLVRRPAMRWKLEVGGWCVME